MAQIAKAFKVLNLSPLIEDAIAELGFKQPTEVQTKAIPAAMNANDIVVSAQTGTGKTAAFSFPLINSLQHSESKKALILVPTREIGIQTYNFINQVTEKDSELRTALLIGGENLRKQEKALAAKPRIIIASPGRLVDLMERKLIQVKDISFLVIDEADRLLDMGFTPQLNQIVSQMPVKRQTMLFSATIDAACLEMAKSYTRKAVYIEVGAKNKAPKQLVTKELNTTKETKFDNLLDELNSRQGAVILFATTKQEVEFLFDELTAYAYPVKRIHGDRTQSQRNSAVKSLKSGETRILVATDVAARGLDIPSIEHVFNYDPPQMAEDYLHRVGRTARAGSSGEVLNFITPDNEKAWAIVLDPNTQKRANEARIPRAKVGKKKANFQYRGKSKKQSKKK